MKRSCGLLQVLESLEDERSGYVGDRGDRVDARLARARLNNRRKGVAAR